MLEPQPHRLSSEEAKLLKDMMKAFDRLRERHPKCAEEEFIVVVTQAVGLIAGSMYAPSAYEEVQACLLKNINSAMQKSSLVFTDSPVAGSA
jgi:hypothetical protein